MLTDVSHLWLIAAIRSRENPMMPRNRVRREAQNTLDSAAAASITKSRLTRDDLKLKSDPLNTFQLHRQKGWPHLNLSWALAIYGSNCSSSRPLNIANKADAFGLAEVIAERHVGVSALDVLGAREPVPKDDVLIWNWNPLVPYVTI